jgi:hypothetical protein
VSRWLGRATVVAIAVVFVAGCALRLIWLDSDSWFPNPSWGNPLSINFEEKASAIPARNWVLFGDLDSYGGQYQPQQMMPLGFLLHAAWYRVFGVSLVQTRLPFVLLNLIAWLGLLVLARRQCGPATLLLLTVVSGFNLTCLAYQRSCLDENLLLGTFVLAAACAPEAGASPRRHFLWGLLAFPPLAVKATGLAFAVGPILAHGARLWTVRRTTPRVAARCAALVAGVALAAASAAALYAAFGLFRPSPFKEWVGRFNASMGHVPPLAGFTAYLAAFEAHLPFPERVTGAILLMAFAAPFVVRNAMSHLRMAWSTLLCAFVAGAPVYLYYKRVVPLVPLVPLVVYLAAAALQGCLDRADAAGTAAAPSGETKSRSGKLRRLERPLFACALVAGLWALLLAARDAADQTTHLFLNRGPVGLYHAEAVAMRSSLPPDAALAAPDTFRLVAFDTPFRYCFTHDMVARHVEGLSEEAAARRDACAAGAPYLAESRAVAEEPGRVTFDVRGVRPPAGTDCHVPGA